MRIASHPSVKTPHGNTIVWRYMALDRFLDLLVHQRLFFSNAATMTDQYEATVPRRNIEQRRKRLLKKGIHGRDLEESLATYEWKTNSLRDLTLLNCWSIDRFESYALWKIYLGGSKAGVAIRTSVSRLRKALERQTTLFGA